MRKITILSLLVSAGALGFGAAQAGHHEGKDGMKDHADHAAKMDAKLEKQFGKVDANGDGVVTADEFMAYKTAEAEGEWDKWTEGDDDGEITLAEAKAKQAEHMAMKKEKKMKKDM